MNIFNFLILGLVHFLTGYGILLNLRTKTSNKVAKSSLAILLGLGISSFIPMLLEIIGIRINEVSVGISLLIFLLASMALVYKQFLDEYKDIGLKIKNIRLYEVFIFFIVAYFLFPAMFMNYYLPCNSRDFTSGAEVVAEYAVKEGRISNSVFDLDMSTTNNHQKPYSLVGLQIIYKLFVQQIGQVWPSLMVVSFFFFFYSHLKGYVHPILVGLLLLLIISAPELYAYIVLVLFDYPNMIFVTLALIIFLNYLMFPTNNRDLWLVSILLGIATFFRSETLILSFFMIGLIIFWKIINRKKLQPVQVLRDSFFLVSGSVIVYFLSIELFIRRMLPSGFDTSSNVTKNLFDLSPLFERLNDMLTKLMFSREPIPDFPYFGLLLYGEIFWIFLFFIFLEVVYLLRYKIYENKIALFWLAAFVVTWFFIGFTGYLLPLADLGNSTKRAMFKLVPIAVLFISSTNILKVVSEFLYQVEFGTKKSGKKKLQKVPKIAKN